MAHTKPKNQPLKPGQRKPIRVPFWIISIGVIGVTASFLPLALAIRARSVTSTEPRIHIMQDMASQTKYKEQAHSLVFADGRADRLPVVGTVSQGNLAEDDHYYRGYNRTWNAQAGKYEITFLSGFPSQVKVDEAFIRHGRERYNIYCLPCHGADGSGNGPISQRAAELGEATWVQPSNLTDADRRNRSEGHLFNTITNGIRNMPGYAAQIPVQDRWAIVAYVRALQLSQYAPASVVPAEKIGTIRQ